MIFYLSCTGNTKWAAERMSEVTGERLLFIPDEAHRDEPYELAEDERIGFCFPVHGWRPPKNVRDFIANLRFTNAEGHFVWALCTAGDTVGEAMDIFCQDLQAIGLNAASTYSLLMPESYVGLPFMDVDKPANAVKKITNADEQLSAYAEQVLSRKSDEHHIVRGRWPRINSRIIGSYFVKKLVTDTPFHVVEERCIGCGRCVDFCPMDNMTQDEKGHPQWLHTGSCLSCFACYHHCPYHAIEYGGRTKKKGQYYFRG